MVFVQINRMKTIKILVVLALVVGAVVYFMQPKNKAAVEKVSADVATDARAASKVATNVAGDIKEGMKKVEDVATNVAAKTKQMATNVINKAADLTTNVVDQAKQVFEGGSH